MVARYETVGPWRLANAQHLYGYNDEMLATILMESAGLRDKQDGHVYDSGTYRVSISTVLPEKPRGKTFKGETAYSKAHAYVHDCLAALKRTAIAART